MEKSAIDYFDLSLRDECHNSEEEKSHQVIFNVAEAAQKIGCLDKMQSLCGINALIYEFSPSCQKSHFNQGICKPYRIYLHLQQCFVHLTVKKHWCGMLGDAYEKWQALLYQWGKRLFREYNGGIFEKLICRRQFLCGFRQDLPAFFPRTWS